MNQSPVQLIPHASSISGAVQKIQVDLSLDGARLALNYQLHCDLADIRIPEMAAACRAEGLWQHSCFELFIKKPDGYEEFNFSPSTEWAHYCFADYRQASENAGALTPPRIRTCLEEGLLTLSTDITLPDESTALGLSAVIEDCQGRLSYWAVHHPSDQPDFHHPDAFTLKLK